MDYEKIMLGEVCMWDQFQREDAGPCADIEWVRKNLKDGHDVQLAGDQDINPEQKAVHVRGNDRMFWFKVTDWIYEAVKSTGYIETSCEGEGDDDFYIIFGTQVI